jgi:hypothetical protein
MAPNYVVHTSRKLTEMRVLHHPRMAEGLTRGCFRGSLAPRGFPDIKHGLIWRKQVEAAMAGLEFQVCFKYVSNVQP